MRSRRHSGAGTLPAAASQAACSESWDSLPDPVRRYLRFAVPPNAAAAIRTVRLRHDGYFRPTPGPRWFPIQAEEDFTLDPPGFVSRARIRMTPFLWIEARDCLISSRGSMLIKFNSIFTMFDGENRIELDQHGSCTEYVDFNGLQVPSRVEVFWDLEAGQFSYARFRVTELEYRP